MDRDSTITQMLQNHKAESWSDLSTAESVAIEVPVYDDERASKLERLDAYVDYCFETYPIVYNWLHREQVQAVVADWNRRRGQARKGVKLSKREFPSSIHNSYERHQSHHHVLILAKKLVGAPPEADNGVGWKACVRHELGHIIDFEKRGRSDHSHKFKSIMRQFGEEVNDGKSAHGLRPDRLDF